MRLLHTAHVPPGEGPHPTIVALHGWGASGHDLLGLAPHLLDGEALVLCPQGEVALEVGPGMTGYGWFPLVPGQAPDPTEFDQGAAAIREFLDQAVEVYPVDRDRLVVAGFSQGGLMAAEQALSAPERFRGLVALSTWFPEPLAERLPPAEGHDDFPVLMIHGTQDMMIPVDRARESRERLRPYGVRLQYREFDMGHEIRPQGLQLIQDWLEKVLE